MRFILGDCGSAYEERVRTLIRFHVQPRFERDDPVFGVIGLEGLAAAATVSFPDAAVRSRRPSADRGELWLELGLEARERSETCERAWWPFRVRRPHVQLNLLGVRLAARGRGYARGLLEQVLALSLETAGSEGVALTTEDPRTVGFYRSAGFDLVAEAHLAPGVDAWIFFREHPGGAVGEPATDRVSRP